MSGHVRILGIDPGLANTGFAVLDRAHGRFAAVAGGVMTTPAGLSLPRRLVMLASDLEAVLDEHRPDAVALEELYFGRNATSALTVGQARGVVLLCAGRRGLPCSSYTPQQIKQAVCGSGSAGKEQVARMIAVQLGLGDGPLPDHAADAFGAAICHFGHVPLGAALAGAAR